MPVCEPLEASLETERYASRHVLNIGKFFLVHKDVQVTAVAPLMEVVAVRVLTRRDLVAEPLAQKLSNVDGSAGHARWLQSIHQIGY